MSGWLRSAPRGALLSDTLFFMSKMLQPRSRPPDPVLQVYPKPGGVERLPGLLPVNPDCPFYKPFDGVLGHGKSLRAEMVLVNTFPDSSMNFNLHSGAIWRRLTNSTKLVPGGLHQKFESDPNSGLIQRQVFRPH